jgi:hypothetical protein
LLPLVPLWERAMPAILLTFDVKLYQAKTGVFLFQEHHR